MALMAALLNGPKLAVLSSDTPFEKHISQLLFAVVIKTTDQARHYSSFLFRTPSLNVMGLSVCTGSGEAPLFAHSISRRFMQRLRIST